MPTYDYQCEACGHGFELFQSMTARVKRKCPECGQTRLVRLIGPGAGFLFKGDGFYVTDYRSDSYKAGEKAAKDPGTKTDSAPTETSKTDSSSGTAKPDGGGVSKAAKKTPKKPT